MNAPMLVCDRVAEFTITGLVTPGALCQLRCSAAQRISKEANAFLFNFTRSVLAVTDEELMMALGEMEPARMQALSGAWIVPQVNFLQFRGVAGRVAPFGIARRAFTAYWRGQAWAREEARLPRWEEG